MPIPPSHIKERLSVAYVTAVVARAGSALSFTNGSDYGTDAYISEVIETPNGKFTESGISLKCQIKSTTSFSLISNNVVYDMEVGAYNKLATRQGRDCILVLLCLPNDAAEWLSLNENQLIIKKCCYWFYISGPKSANTSSHRIRIPRSQVFAPQAVIDLLTLVRNGGLDNG